MTIEKETRRSAVFEGDGSLKALPFAFKVFAPEDVAVESTIGTFTHGQGCAVRLNAEQNASPGGTVTLDAPLPAGSKAVVLSRMKALQPVDLSNQGGFYPQVINGALDRLTILVQQLMERADRTPALPAPSGADMDEFVRRLLAAYALRPLLEKLQNDDAVKQLLDLLAGERAMMLDGEQTATGRKTFAGGVAASTYGFVGRPESTISMEDDGSLVLKTQAEGMPALIFKLDASDYTFRFDIDGLSGFRFGNAAFEYWNQGEKRWSVFDFIDKQMMNGMLPVGTWLMLPKSAANNAYWLPTNGAEVYREDYPELFALIGTRFGTGDGRMTFKLPNAQLNPLNEDFINCIKYR